MGAKFGDECADAVGPWLEDRYFQKQGQRTMNMDSCLESLCDLELNALIKFCKTADHKLLDIPIHHIPDSDVHDNASGSDVHADAHVDNVSAKAPSETRPFKMAAITKRGMAQSRSKS